MTQKQKSALARIISDMIKADNIIDIGEIQAMQELTIKYGISPQNMEQARKMRFSDSVNELKSLEQEEREEIYEHIKKLTMSDNVCVQKEALLMIALKYCLLESNQHTLSLPGKSFKPKLISCPTSESSINDPYIVYIESSYDEKRNEDISKNFRLIVAEAQLKGFHFIYIPELVKEFQQMSAEYVQDVIKFMAPSMEDNYVKRIYRDLGRMTTQSFFLEVLYERLNVRVDRDVVPSLLINIGTSVVPYCVIEGPVQYYTEFLHLPLCKETFSTVDEMLSYYSSIVNFPERPQHGNSNQFRYFGFYKALFNFLIAPPRTKPNVTFVEANMRSNRYSVVFQSEGQSVDSCNYRRTMWLTPKEFEVYKKIALSGWNISRGGRIAPVVSHIKNKIRETLIDLTEPETYMPIKNGNTYRLDIADSMLFEEVSEYRDDSLITTIRPLKRIVE